MQLSYRIDMAPESVWMMVTVDAEVKSNLPYVQELGDFIAHKKYFTTREGLPSYLIKYTLSGEGVLDYEDQHILVPDGHFFWIDCQKHQHYHTDAHTGNWRVVWVHFYGANCSYYYERFLSANNGRNDGELPSDNNVAASIYALTNIYREGNISFGADIRSSALLTGIMSECISAAAQRPGQPSSRYVRQVRDYITSHFRETVTLDALSRELSLNKYYLQKLFKSSTGQTPNEYLTNLRLNRAKELLRATEEPVSLIAEDAGIENVSHFIKLFKQSEGITPGVYRKRWRG